MKMPCKKCPWVHPEKWGLSIAQVEMEMKAYAEASNIPINSMQVCHKKVANETADKQFALNGNDSDDFTFTTNSNDQCVGQKLHGNHFSAQ